MIKLVIGGIYILGVISGGLVFLLLIKLIRQQIYSNNKQALKEEVKEEINRYLAGEEVVLTADFSEQKRVILEEIIINYLQQVKGTTEAKLKSLAQESGVIDAKLEQLVNSTQWWEKSEAAYVLGKLEATAASSDLLDLLDATNSDVRYQSARALVKITGSEYLELVIKKLLSLAVYPQDEILRVIEEVNGDIYEELKPLMDTGEINKQIIAIRGLGLKNDYRVLAWIKKYLHSINSQLVVACLQAAYQIGDVGDQEYFKLLLTTKDSYRAEVRANLALVLEKFRNSTSRNQLKKLMTDQQWQVRYNAAQSLLAHGERGIVTLSEQLQSDDQFARDMAWQVLQPEIVFNGLLNHEERTGYLEVLENVKKYLIETNKEGVKCELESNFT
ncbi:MAG: HEAT repeat domain-containing protein [Bacillota bacterium]